MGEKIKRPSMMVLDRGSSSASHLDPSSSAPLLPQCHDHAHLSSLPKSFANILIALVGAGVLGLPYTFMKTGWLSGLIILVMVAALTYYCMLLLIWTKRNLEHKGHPKIRSFGDVALTVSGPVGKAIVDAMIVLSQAGFCISYLIFIGNSLSSIFSQPNHSDNYFNFPTKNRSFLQEFKIMGIAAKSIFIWAVFPFQIGLSAIRALTHLAPLSIFADVIDIAAMAAVMVEDVVAYLHSKNVLKPFTNLRTIIYGIGVAIYGFEGMGMVIPLEVEADRKKKFGGVLGLAIFFVTATYAGFGILGYLAFGEETRDIITLNLGRNVVTDVVQVGLCINLFLTFPLMMNPVHEVVEGRFNGGRYSFGLRCLSVFLTTIVALFVPNFADFLSLVGSSVCCALGFILPATFHLQACRKESRWVEVVADAAIVCFGAVFAVLGTISSVQNIFF